MSYISVAYKNYDNTRWKQFYPPSVVWGTYSM